MIAKHTRQHTRQHTQPAPLASPESRPDSCSLTPVVLPFGDPSARRRGARLAAAGRPIGLFLGGLCVALGDGSKRAFAEWTIRSKGEGRIGRPMATILPASEVIRRVDPDAIPPALHHIFLDADELVARLGAMIFIRLPVRESVARTIPPWLLSRGTSGEPLIQLMDPSGHDPLRHFLQEVLDQGVRYLAGSSMNISGHPELVKREDGITFARAKGIPLFLADRLSPIGITGSYPILLLDRSGVHLVREGPVPGWVFERLLEHPIDFASARPAKYPQLPLGRDFLDGLRPQEIRLAILLRLQGWSETAVRSRLSLTTPTVQSFFCAGAAGVCLGGRPYCAGRTRSSGAGRARCTAAAGPRTASCSTPAGSAGAAAEAPVLRARTSAAASRRRPEREAGPVPPPLAPHRRGRRCRARRGSCPPRAAPAQKERPSDHSTAAAGPAQRKQPPTGEKPTLPRPAPAHTHRPLLGDEALLLTGRARLTRWAAGSGRSACARRRWRSGAARGAGRSPTSGRDQGRGRRATSRWRRAPGRLPAGPGGD
jgi:hypothetical protein